MYFFSQIAKPIIYQWCLGVQEEKQLYDGVSYQVRFHSMSCSLFSTPMFSLPYEKLRVLPWIDKRFVLNNLSTLNEVKKIRTMLYENSRLSFSKTKL